MSEIKLEAGQRVLLRNGLVGVVELSPLQYPYRVRDYNLTPNGKFHADGRECSCDVVEILPPETTIDPKWEIGVWYPCRAEACEGKIFELGMPGADRMVGIVRTCQDHKDWCVTTWAKTGENSVLGHSLIPPAPPAPKRHSVTYWANCYVKSDDKTVFYGHYLNKEDADKGASPDRNACVPYTIEFTEGEGFS